MREIKGSIGVVLMITLAIAVVPAQQIERRRGVTPEDYYSFEFLSDPEVSPDGKLVAYIVTTVDQKQNRRHSNIWVAATAGSREPRPFTTNQTL